ncbi:MAG TPA: hypothetical protein VFK82_04210 [Burkholderiaceae bacterium]|nr:hypothetical protein [Burkholderiaceae bacterium]
MSAVATAKTQEICGFPGIIPHRVCPETATPGFPEVWFLSKRLLPLIPAGLLVQQILSTPDHLTIHVTPREPWAACPTCARPSWRVHSRYDRVLQDLP